MGYIILQLSRFFETLIFAVGLHLTISIGGISFFGFSVVYLAGAYAFAIAAAAGIAFWPAAALAVLTVAIIGGFFALLYVRLSDDSFAVFGVASIFGFDALLRSWDSVTGGVLGIAGVPRPPGAESSMNLLWIIMAVAILALASEDILLRTAFGRSLIAHKENASLLGSAGVSPVRIGAIAIISAAVLTGISGLLGAWRIQYLDPSFGGVPAFIFGLTIAVMAAKPKISWLIGASAVVTLLPELLRFLPLPQNLFADLRILIYCIALIVLVHRISATYTDGKRVI